MNMRKQRLMGAGLLAISAAMAALAWMGSTPEERDITAAVLLAPLGVWLLVTKEYVLYDSGTAPDAARYRGRRSKSKKGAWITWQGNGLLKRRASKAGRM